MLKYYKAMKGATQRKYNSSNAARLQKNQTGITATSDESYKQPSWPLETVIADWYSRNAPGEDDHYTQPGIFYREVLSAQDKKNLVSNIVGAMSGIDGPKKAEILNRQLCHFFSADIGLGMAVAQGLGVNAEDAMPKEHVAAKEPVLA